MRTAWRLWLVPALVAVAGCGGPNLHPVQGKVVFPDGTPLATGTVVFKPKDPNAVMSPRGIIRGDGNFRASTLKEGDGAPAGDYQVMIAPEAVIEAPPTPPFDRRFMSFESSGLVFTVKPGKNDFYTITIEKARGR